MLVKCEIVGEMLHKVSDFRIQYGMSDLIDYVFIFIAVIFNVVLIIFTIIISKLFIYLVSI
jgi:hypothetical protein